ncbi:MAG: tetratricopeptide repeat protein [Sideroxydans sp.]|nr:tetratricopeptide repeat protein [Sideroxydans sp.]
MRKIGITLLGVFFSLSVSATEALVAMNGFIKADFRNEIAAPKLSRLLGAGAGYLYVSKQDGVVEAISADGKVVNVFSNKDGDTVLLKRPEAVAVDGDVLYVVDSETSQVVMYSITNAKFLGKFGASSGGFFGGGDGNSLKSPQGITAQDGVVYVADTGNARIQLFGVNGVFIQTLSLNAGKTLEEGKESPFKLKEAVSVGIDHLGRLYILDVDDSMVKVYEPSGSYVKSLPTTGKPYAISVAEDGVYVVDEVTQVISKFGLDGKLAYTFGSKGEGKGQFKKVSGMAVEKGQRVFVGDEGKALVSAFLTVASGRVEAVPKMVGRTSVLWKGGISVDVTTMAGDAKGNLYAVSKDRRRVLKINSDKVVSEIKLDDMEIAAIALDKDGALWIADNKKKRCVQLDGEGKVTSAFGSSGSGAGQFSNLSALTVSSSGLVFVADQGNRTISIFRGDGVYLNNLAGATNITNPLAMAFDPKDNLYILDGNRNTVSVFTANGDFVQELGKVKEGSVFAEPVGMAVTADEIWLLDGHQVVSLSHKGDLLRVFGAEKTGSGATGTPVALATAGGSSLFIADGEGKRIQSFSVLYKMNQLQQLTTQSKVHAIELTWAKPVVPYVKEYRVYRSSAELSGYAQVATTVSNNYVDANLDADMQNYYRVAAVSDTGYEGATSAAVSGISAKFQPKPVGVVNVETTPWQAKLVWDAVDSQYFAAYRIYQKEGDAMVKVAETATPAFSKDALQPETKYQFSVSVLSTDGTESEKVPVEATTLVFNRPPLDIEVLKLSDVFSNSYKQYERDGIGRIRLSNNTDKPMDKIRVTFVLKNFMDYSTETKIAKLLPGQSEELLLKAVFNNSILTVTEDSAVQAEVEASYFENGKRISYSRSATVNVYDKHRLTWDERDRFASFVTPKDAPIINLAREVVGEYKETKDEARLAAAFFDAMGVHGLTYIQDPSNPYQVSSGKANTVDYIQFPRETLERKSGDCDDLVAFYSSGLESMGINTRVLEVPGHMLMMFSTGIPAESDAYTMDNLYVIYEDVLWIPVETTLVGNSFIKAWESGSATYYKYQDKGLTILDVHNAWENFKPASLPDLEWKPSGLTRAAIEKKFPSDNMSVLKISSQVKTRRYLDIIKASPSDVDAHLQMGIILAKLGDRKEAMKYFDKVIGIDAKNASALNNRGNLFMIDDKYQDAQKAYQAASLASPKDPLVWVNLARSYARTGDTTKAKAAFVKAQGLDPKIKEQFRALGLELLNAL